jgi:hypothetical protein
MLKQAYISAPLTGVEDLNSQKYFYEEIGHIVKRAGYLPYVPHQHTDPVQHAHTTAAEVYALDRDTIVKSALILAYVGTPSIGVGQEVEIAHQNGIPVMLLFEESRPVSRMVRGNPSVIFEIVAPTRERLLQRLADVFFNPNLAMAAGLELSPST